MFRQRCWSRLRLPPDWNHCRPQFSSLCPRVCAVALPTHAWIGGRTPLHFRFLAHTTLRSPTCALLHVPLPALLLSLSVLLPQVSLASALIRPRPSTEQEPSLSCRSKWGRSSRHQVLHPLWAHLRCWPPPSPEPAEPSTSFASPTRHYLTSPTPALTPPSASHWSPPLPKMHHHGLSTRVGPSSLVHFKLVPHLSVFL
jgi:hypothetical protein